MINSSFRVYRDRLLAFIAKHSAPSFPHEVREEAFDAASEFNGLALALFALQFEQVLPFRRLCEARGKTPERVEHWREIPALPTAAFKDFEVSSLPPGHRTAVFHSSGTTERRPSRHFHSEESLKIYEASLLPWFRAHVLPELSASANGHGHSSSSSGSATETPWPAEDLARFVILTPPPALAPHSSLVHMFETVRQRFGASESVFAGITAATGDWIVDTNIAITAFRLAMSQARPVVILGTAFSYVHLLDSLRAQRLVLRLPSGSRAVETGGYKGRSRTLPRDELYAAISEILGISARHIVCEYGMSELSSQAYDRVSGAAPIADGPSPSADPESRFARGPARLAARIQTADNFHFPPWAAFEIISPETGAAAGEGQIGLLRVVDLANVYSVLALQTEDLGVRWGNGFELLGRAPRSEVRGCSLLSVDA